MSRLIIHVGTHKTATTHIQKTLHANWRRLERHGVAYPRIGVAHGQHSLATAWIELPEVYRIADPRQAWLDLSKTYASSDKTVVISSEELSRLLPTCVDMAELNSLTCSFDEVRIVCVLRNQAAFMQSLYQELSRSFVIGPWRSMFRNAMVKSMIAGFAVDYNLLYDQFLTGFQPSQIVFLSYDNASLGPDGILGTILKEIRDDLSVSDLELKSARSNVSLPPLANLLANEIAHPSVAEPALVQRLCNCIGEFFPEGTRTTIFSLAEMEQVEHVFAPLNRRLVERVSPFQSGLDLSATPKDAPQLFYRDQLKDAFWLAALRRLAR